MRCECGYEGIPTVHDDPADRHWKCPQCQRRRPLPLRHDPMPPEPDGRVVCSQCGMHGDLTKTECPGHGANWGEPVAWCTCGEFGPAPAKWGDTLKCKRCGKQYPHYEPAPPAARRGRALTAEDAELLDKLKALARLRQVGRGGRRETMKTSDQLLREIVKAYERCAGSWSGADGNVICSADPDDEAAVDILQKLLAEATTAVAEGSC